jgi:hypothetical protein
MGRDLSSNERALLEWLLTDPRISDADSLRAQIPFTYVVDDVPELPTYLHLAVSGVSPAACEDGVLPGGAVVESASGEATGGLMLWVKDGCLSSVEHWWVTDEMPQEFPSVDRLRPWRPEESDQALRHDLGEP